MASLLDMLGLGQQNASYQEPSHLAQNVQWARLGPYQTQLQPPQEQAFRQWLQANASKAPGIRTFNPNNPISDYDMRGFWQATQAGDPRAHTGVNPSDQTIHFTDVWKTPYHHSFSRESQYAMPDAPQWKGSDAGGWYLQDKYGNVLFDERMSRMR